MMTEFEFGYICPKCGRGGGEVLFNIDGDCYEIDIVKCKHCGHVYPVLWVSEDCENTPEIDTDTGTLDFYCPVCGSVIDFENAESVVNGNEYTIIVTCPNCGTKLEKVFLRFNSEHAEEEFAKVRKRI